MTAEATCIHGIPWSHACAMCGRPIDIPFQPLMPTMMSPNPNPPYLPVNVPLSFIGVTVVMVDSEGNVRIKKDEPLPEGWHR
jgi:hypothetical protein